MEDRESLEEFILAHIGDLSVTAWKGYCQSGRGIVSFSMDAVHREPWDTFELRYETEMEEAGEGAQTEFGELVASYDPESEFLCAVMDSESETARVFCLSHPLPPREAERASNARFN